MAQLLSKHTLFLVHCPPNGDKKVEEVFTSPTKDDTAQEFLKFANRQTEETRIVWQDKWGNLRGYDPERDADAILQPNSRVRELVEAYLKQVVAA